MVRGSPGDAGLDAGAQLGHAQQQLERALHGVVRLRLPPLLRGKWQLCTINRRPRGASGCGEDCRGAAQQRVGLLEVSCSLLLWWFVRSVVW